VPFALSGPALSNSGRIPRKYMLYGENLSPPLEWRDAPSGIKSFALVVVNPEGPNGTFHHWVLSNISAGRNRIPQDVGPGTKTEILSVGVNDFGHPRNENPQSPKTHGPHHDQFKLAALDVE
jgi:Raf kinase inhibitor-like YbhB/YbcL family protein